jgi:hypothetical protein
LQYTGRENDGTGLYYYRARYYSPALQRFISIDPSGSPNRPATFIQNMPIVGGGNCFPLVITQPDRTQYLYVKDQPLRISDPSGLATTSACDYYDKTCEKNYPARKRLDKNDSIAASQAYECQAGQCCRDFGNDPQSNSIRECLILADMVGNGMGCRDMPEPQRSQCRATAHIKCYVLNNRGPDRIPQSCQPLKKGLGF